MRKQPRNSDGTLRRANRPQRLTNRSLIARWVEAETVHLKHLGMSYQTIGAHVMRVAHGEQQPMIALPENATFTASYRVSAQAIHRAFVRAMARVPAAEAAHHRKLDTERCESMFLSLQAGIRQGETKSIEAGVRVLAHKAKLNGYIGPSKIEVTGKEGGPVPITWEAINRLIAEADVEVK